MRSFRCHGMWRLPTSRSPQVGALAVVGELVVLHHRLALLAPRHHEPTLTRNFTGVGPMPNCSRSLRST